MELLGPVGAARSVPAKDHRGGARCLPRKGRAVRTLSCNTAGTQRRRDELPRRPSLDGSRGHGFARHCGRAGSRYQRPSPTSTSTSPPADNPAMPDFARARHKSRPVERIGLRGRPVLLLYPAGPDFAPAFFGALLAGAIATPVPVPRFESQYHRL